ncbi:MAG: hypothetical protein AB4040_10760 [Synechococcus sp.]
MLDKSQRPDVDWPARFYPYEGAIFPKKALPYNTHLYRLTWNDSRSQPTFEIAVHDG